jgi:hypothetical protein
MNADWIHGWPESPLVGSASNRLNLALIAMLSQSYIYLLVAIYFKNSEHSMRERLATR